MLRALRFMDSMIQRDTLQKVAFLNDLTTFWDKFDDRILRLKVSPFALNGPVVYCTSVSQHHPCSKYLELNQMPGKPAVSRDLISSFSCIS